MRPLGAFRRTAGAAFLAPVLLVAAGCGTGPEVGMAEGLMASEVHPSADSLANWLAGPPADEDTERRALDGLERAMELVEGGAHSEAARLASEALALLPALGDWRPLLEAELLLPTGDTAAVRTAIDALEPEGELRSRWGWRVLADAREAAGDREGARAEAQAAATTETDPGRAAEAWLHAGRLGLALGDSVRARADLDRAFGMGVRYPSARGAARLLDRLPGSFPAEVERELGRALFADGSWEAAHRRLSPHLASTTDPDEAAELRLALGRALFELRRHAEAEAMLAPLVETAEGGPATVEALYWRGRAALERGALAAAEASFRRLAEVAPSSIEASEGWSLLLRRELATGFGPRARALLDELLRTGVRGSAAEGLVVELGTLEYLAGNLEAAARAFEGLHASTERTAGRQQAAYWAGLALDRQGDGAEAARRLEAAHAEDPFGTYGVFAGERIGAPVIEPGLPPGPDPLPALEGEIRNALTRLRVHRIVPTPGSFAWELERLTAHFFERGEGVYDFADALVEGGFALQAISLGREIRRVEGAWNLRLLRIVHPFPYRDAIVREADARGLDPFFVAGLIRQESAFDARIASGAGAVGLMQLMPATAREVAGSLGIRYDPELLREPEVNVRLGTTYLASMLARFDGRAEDALAAYNAGPTRIRQWREGPTYRDRDVFMEHIPFQETRNYVKVVQQYARIYTALYGCGDFEPCWGLSYPEAVASSPVARGAPGPSTAR